LLDEGELLAATRDVARQRQCNDEEQAPFAGARSMEHLVWHRFVQGSARGRGDLAGSFQWRCPRRGRRGRDQPGRAFALGSLGGARGRQRLDGGGQVARIEAGIESADALEQRRMGREPAAERARAALEQHVRDLFGVDRHDARRIAADFLQGAGEPVRLARELHRRGVGQSLAIARHSGLDEPREQHADPADDQQSDGDRHRGRDSAAVLAAARTRVAHAPQEPAADQRKNEDAERQADQLLV
jgi:hypothetical protein